MSRVRASVLGILTAALALVFLAFPIIDTTLGQWSIVLTVAWPLFVIGLLIVYIPHVRANPRIATDSKKTWLISLLVFNVFAMSYYWSKYMYHRASRA
jgi:hypothetical protein